MSHSEDYRERCLIAEALLEESQKRLKGFYDIIPYGIFVTDQNGHYLEVNDEACRISGYSEVELLERSISDMIPHEAKSCGIEHFQRLLDHGISRGEVPFLHKSGEIRFWSVNAVKLSEYRFLGIVEETTDRHRAEQDLRRSEAVMRTFFNAITESVCLFELNGTLLMVNATFARRLGRRADECIGRSIYSLVDAELAEKRRAMADSVIKKRKGISFEDQRDGRWFRHSLFPVFDVEGEIVQLALYAVDVTEHRKVEADYQNLFQEMRDGFARHEIICDPEGRPVDYRFLAVNSAFEQITGLRGNHLIGRTVKEVLPEIEGHWIDHYGRVALTGESIQFEAYSGELGKHFEVRAYRPAPHQFATIFVDISERKRTEEEHQRLVTAINQVGECIVITDPAGTIEFVNPAFERVTGYSHQEVIGQNTSIFNSGLQDRNFYEELWRTISGGEVWRGRLMNKRRDGSTYTEEMTVSPVCDNSGTIVNYVAVKRDITPILELEKRLSQAEKIEAIGVLAGGIAHDFNNILFPIIGFSELLLDDLPQGDSRHQKVLEIYSGARRAADLVQQILAFSRQSNPERQPVNVQKSVREVLSLSRSAIPSNIAIEGDLGGDPMTVSIDPIHLHQMVMNLVTNAYQALEERNSGLIKVSVTLREIEGPVRSNEGLKAGSYVAISVSDDGCGIDSSLLGRIFEPYFTTKTPGRGTGLGLSIVHGLVRKYGGDISVESQSEHGSIFTLLLPRLAVVSEAGSQSLNESYAGGERILIIDDESAIVRMETIMLERFGYSVSGYSMSVEALDAFRAEPQRFDLVITDMAMPVMTGLQLAGEMLSIRPDIPILIATGFSEQVDRQRIEALGIKGFLMKPVLSRELGREVRRLLDESLKSRIRGRILVIDDEPAVRLLFREKLSLDGCEVLDAANGSEGLAVCRRERPDLVVTDLIMPDKEGIETIMDIRREFPELSIIAISGGGISTSPDTYLDMAERLGARQVFTKPIEWPSFYRAVIELLHSGSRK